MLFVLFVCYRYILPIRITDHSDSVWMNCFDETAALILGMPADDFRKLRVIVYLYHIFFYSLINIFNFLIYIYTYTFYQDVDPYGYENHIKNQLWESYIFKVCTQLKTFNVSIKY